MLVPAGPPIATFGTLNVLDPYVNAEKLYDASWTNSQLPRDATYSSTNYVFVWSSLRTRMLNQFLWKIPISLISGTMESHYNSFGYNSIRACIPCSQGLLI